MGVDGRVARLDRAQFRRMLAAEPDIAEIVVRAFILRAHRRAPAGSSGCTRLTALHLHLDDGSTLRGRTVVVATGARYRRLDGVPDAARNTEWLSGTVELDPYGFVRTGGAVQPFNGRPPTGLETSALGIFAVGDVRADSTKRVASGVGEGSVVVAAVRRALRDT